MYDAGAAQQSAALLNTRTGHHADTDPHPIILYVLNKSVVQLALKIQGENVVLMTFVMIIFVRINYLQYLLCQQPFN